MLEKAGARRIIERMTVRDYLRARRQRKARKRYELEKARREAANDPKAMERVKDSARMSGGGGWSGGGGGG